MGTPRVVLDPPVLDQDLRVEQRVELLDGQEFVAQPSVERLDEGVLPRRTRLDVARARARATAPVPQRVGGELGAGYGPAIPDSLPGDIVAKTRSSGKPGQASYAPTQQPSERLRFQLSRQSTQYAGKY